MITYSHASLGRFFGVKAGIATVIFAVTWLAASVAAAQDGIDDYVRSNVASILYHELGHAIIDMMQVPIYGQEEDAADVLSILLIDLSFQEDSAQRIATDAAFGFQAEAESASPMFWDVHGPDEQRYFNLICVFYGGNPDARADLAADLGLPQERAEYCDAEYDQAMDSWGAVLDEMSELSGKLLFAQPATGFFAQAVAEEITALNSVMGFPNDLRVRVEPCGEANAFYDPQTQSITMCEEFEAHLRAQF